MTIAEKLINQGRAEAMLTERRKTLARQLEKKFGLSEDERHFIDSIEDLDRLSGALDEILFAESKQQVLDKLKP